MDYQATLYDPIYSNIGVEATITPSSSAPAAGVTVVNVTRSYQVPGEITVESMKPVYAVRMVELTANGLTRSDLNQSQLTVSDVTWTIEATKPVPSPNGEADGELHMILLEP